MAPASEQVSKPATDVVLEYNVETALSKMKISREFLSFVKEGGVSWSTFGRMNSALYGAKLQRIYEMAKLSAENIFVVHLFFSLVKRKKRVLDGLANMDENVKRMPWFEPVRSFIAGYITDYNTGAQNPAKFPGTHIPTVNPGLDLLCWRLWAPKETLTLDNFFKRTTTVQLFLNKAMQDKAHAGYKEYWDETVQGTKNDVKTEDAKYRKEYYETSAGDMYLLVNMQLRLVSPTDPKNGYSEEDILKWLSEEGSSGKFEASSSK